MMKTLSRMLLHACSALMALALISFAAARQEGPAPETVATSLYQSMEWRCIGPFRGGRVTAVAGVPSQSMVFYMGATGGGVWKTDDAGITWRNISDGFFKTGSVGAIAVADSDPNVVYAGMGEAPVRGVMTTHGDGVYKSTDAGRSWKHIGLAATRHISQLIVHPQNADIAFVAAQGSPFGPNAERGIYRTIDGGKTWQQVHHVDQNSGASDLSIDPTNPRALYAAYWDHRRQPWMVRSGGPGSGLYKTTDGGDSWAKITNGLPKGTMGKIAVSVSPANSDRVWALIEADDGGLFRSDDAGRSFQRINEERRLRTRAWYYINVFADPQNADIVYVANAPLLKSIDGGRTFQNLPTPHGDNHALWINPRNNSTLINGNDGGANISFNGGRSWSPQNNQPTAQFYRVITDNQFPYYVYGGQQDNSTVAIASRTPSGGIDRPDWFPVGGGESAYVAFDPRDPTYIYAGSYQGIITEYDSRTKKTRNVMAYPALGLAEPSNEQKYRFNWNAPILVSPHNPRIIYHAANVLLRSDNRGLRWTAISPDLTRNDKSKQGVGGGPLANEGAGGEVYNTIFYATESSLQAGLIWTGSDDGLVHITRDGGKNWANVTPPDIGEAQINSIDASPHDAAKAFVVAHRYKFNDLTPHIFRTTDYGKTWERRVKGIPEDEIVRVVREDPARKGLIYAGTERGVYVSFNDGAAWQSLQLNLPVVPVTDLTVRNNDLVASTQGRAFWILDDLTPLHQIAAGSGRGDYLFKPRAAYLFGGGGGFAQAGVGRNPPSGVVIYYNLVKAPEAKLSLEIFDSAGKVIRRFTNEEARPSEGPPAPRLTTRAGMNRFVWDFRVAPYPRIPGITMLGSGQGYRAAPGTYQARLSVGDKTFTQSFEVLVDPRLSVAASDIRAEQELAASVYQRINEIHRSVLQLRDVREQIKALIERAKDHPNAGSLVSIGKTLIDKMTALEESLIQPRRRVQQEEINFRNQLADYYIHLLDAIDSSGPPLTEGMQQRFKDLEAMWAGRRETLTRLLGEELSSFNEMFRKNGLPVVIAPTER